MCIRDSVYVVPEQELPDGNFPTVSYPNPEAKEAFELGLKLAKEKDADLVLATDPDADRLGVYVKDAKSGEYIPLTGNMSGSLLCEYVLSQKQAEGKSPADGQVVKLSLIQILPWAEKRSCLSGPFQWAIKDPAHALLQSYALPVFPYEDAHLGKWE